MDRIPEPFQFNPLKHHLRYIRDFLHACENTPVNPELIRTIRHIGTSVMDVYAGEYSVHEILLQSGNFLHAHNLSEHKDFSSWAGTGFPDFRMITLQDDSQWILKYHDSMTRYVHIFPSRTGPHTFRLKANTLKSAVLYIIVSGKDYVAENDLNRARALINLSPVKEVAETRAISEMIEILRNQ